MAFAALLFAPEVLTASKRCWVLDHHGDVEGEEGGGRKSCRYGMVWNGMEWYGGFTNWLFHSGIGNTRFICLQLSESFTP